MQIHQTKLKSGLKIIVVEMPDVRSVATMLFVRTGSRNETKEINGISHFLEHMVFKGTKKFPDQLAVARAIEGIGGQLNAWTDQDHTNFYTVVPSRFADRGMEVVSELVCRPLLREEDLIHERGVILEEMNRRADSPDDYVWELAIEQMWPNQPLGWPVIGQKDVIEKIKIEQFKQYREKWYRPENMVLTVAGRITEKEATELAKKYFDDLFHLPIQDKPVASKDEQVAAGANIVNKQTDQAHLILSVKTFDRFDHDRFALGVLNTILGAGMSSRLFMEIREKRGLCYSIHSAIEYYHDAGGFFIHSGLNSQKLESAVAAICDELNKLKKEKVKAHELDEAKQLIAGSLEMSADSSSSLAIMFGKQLLLDEKIMSIDEIIKKYQAVTAEDIQKVAQRVLRIEKANLTVIAPLDQKIENILKDKIKF